MKLFKNNTKQNNDLPLRNTNNRPPNLNDITLPSTTEGELDIGNPTRTSENSPSSHNNYNQNNTDENDSMFRRNKAGISSQGLSSGSRGGGGARGGGGHFQPFHVLRHPFFLATFVVAVVAWFTAFIGQCVTEGQLNLLGHGPVVGVLWFAILLQLVVNIHLFIALSLDALALHRFQLAVVTAILVPFAVNGVQFIYQGEDRDGQKGSSALKAVGAGWLLLAMVDILWVLYLTSEEDSFFFSVFNMFGDGGLSSPERAHHNTFSTDPNAIDLVSAHHNINDGASGNNLGYVNGGGYSVAPQHGGTPVKTKPSMVAERPASPSPGYRPSGAQNEQSFGLRAKALYAYSASPDDPNEVSFGKGEIIEIIDSSGKWWQCKTSAGQIGIAPSNYLQLL